MISIEEAEKIILSQIIDYGIEALPFEQSLGRVLAEDMKADRDLPPFDRATMDGIAISYKAVVSGIDTFKIKATQAAGDEPLNISKPDECIEIMTGAALSPAVDTVIRYEDLEISGGLALVTVKGITKRQNIHPKGSDKKLDDVVAAAGQLITPAIISLAASLGKSILQVKKLPKVIIISSGGELVEVNQTPTVYQIRRSNSYTVRAVLKQYNLNADISHIPDEPEITKRQIAAALQNYDVILLSGGISMGKFDYVPYALEALQVKKLFHKVQQRPGKPFWFGRHNNGVLVFAFPGNPVATFMCLNRYLLQWLNTVLCLPPKPPVDAILDQDFSFQPALDYFLQVKLRFNTQGSLIATPVEGNGSGDFVNLADTNAFMELPSVNRSEFRKGEVYKVLVFN